MGIEEAIEKLNLVVRMKNWGDTYTIGELEAIDTLLKKWKSLESKLRNEIENFKTLENELYETNEMGAVHAQGQGQEARFILKFMNK